MSSSAATELSSEATTMRQAAVQLVVLLNGGKSATQAQPASKASKRQKDAQPQTAAA